MFEVLGDTIGQTSFEVGPDKFIGIKLRCVSRKVKGLDSRIVSKDLLDELGSVKRASVPEKDDRAWEVAREMTEKLPDLFGSDVLVGMEACVEAKSFSLGRDGDGGDSRDFGPASGDNEGGSFSFNRPSPLEIGDKRESALIQEDQAGSKPRGLFLYEAKRETSSNGWLVPDALWLSSRASGSSSPNGPSNSTSCRYNSSPGSSFERLGRFVSKSKDPSSSRLPRALSPRCAPRLFSAPLTKAGDVPYAAWTSSPPVLSCGRLDANAPRSLTMRSVSAPPSDKCGLVSKAGRRIAVFFRVFGVCREVSLCPPRLPLYDRPKLVSIE